MNMTKEQRAEVRQIKQGLRQIERDFQHDKKEITTNAKASLRAHNALVKKLDRELARIVKRETSMKQRLTKRLLILEGRLS